MCAIWQHQQHLQRKNVHSQMPRAHFSNQTAKFDPFPNPHHPTFSNMHNIWVRLNAVIFFALTVLLALATLAALRFDTRTK